MCLEYATVPVGQPRAIRIEKDAIPLPGSRTQYRPQQWKIARLLQDFDLKDKKDTTKNIVYYTTSFEPEPVHRLSAVRSAERTVGPRHARTSPSASRTTCPTTSH